MVKHYVEVVCDQCGDAEHFDPSEWQKTARGYGWVITKSRRHFCSIECYNFLREIGK